MRANFKRYVEQISQNVITLVKIEKSRRVVESRPVCMDLNEDLNTK